MPIFVALVLLLDNLPFILLRSRLWFLTILHIEKLPSAGILWFWRMTSPLERFNNHIISSFKTQFQLLHDLVVDLGNICLFNYLRHQNAIVSAPLQMVADAGSTSFLSKSLFISINWLLQSLSSFLNIEFQHTLIWVWLLITFVNFRCSSSFFIWRTTSFFFYLFCSHNVLFYFILIIVCNFSWHFTTFSWCVLLCSVIGLSSSFDWAARKLNCSLAVHLLHFGTVLRFFILVPSQSLVTEPRWIFQLLWRLSVIIITFDSLFMASWRLFFISNFFDFDLIKILKVYRAIQSSITFLRFTGRASIVWFIDYIEMTWQLSKFLVSLVKEIVDCGHLVVFIGI